MLCALRTIPGISAVFSPVGCESSPLPLALSSFALCVAAGPSPRTQMSPVVAVACVLSCLQLARLAPRPGFTRLHGLSGSAGKCSRASRWVTCSFFHGCLLSIDDKQLGLQSNFAFLLDTGHVMIFIQESLLGSFKTTFCQWFFWDLEFINLGPFCVYGHSCPHFFLFFNTRVSLTKKALKSRIKSRLVSVSLQVPSAGSG